MVEKVLKFKVGSPLKLHSGMIRKSHAIYHYSYNLPVEKDNKKKYIINHCTGFLLRSAMQKPVSSNVKKKI